MNLRTYLNSLPRGGVSEFAEKIGITPIYLSQLASVQDGREPSPSLCVAIEKSSGASVTRRDLRPNDWRQIWPELAEKTAHAPKNGRKKPVAQDAIKDMGIHP